MALGDVVVSELLHYYELKKLKPGADAAELLGTGYIRWLRRLVGRGGPRRSHGESTTGTRSPLHIRWQPVSPRLSSTARDLDRVSPHWRAPLQVTRPDRDSSPKIKQGELVCGDKLLSDADAAEVGEIVATYERALAVDMETVGVAQAALEAADDGLALSFVALRGISDWIDGESNQATRNQWKDAACEAAVAAAIGLVCATPSATLAPPMHTPTPTDTEARRSLRDRMAVTYPIPAVPFESLIESGSRTLSRNDALTIAAEGDGVALIGEAGAGKSSVVHQAARGSMSPLDPLPVLIDLKHWRPEYGHGLTRDPSGENLLPSLECLLRASVGRMNAELLEEVVKDQPVLLFVDGLNEVPFGETGRPILTLLHEYMRVRRNVRVLVTDRTAGEFYRDSGWQVMHLQPLDDTEVFRVVQEQLGAEAAGRARGEDLLRTPFFLDRALRGDELALASRASAVGDFFSRQLGITGAALDRLAEAAYDVYVDHHQRSFPPSALTSTAGEETVRTLKQAGTVTGDDDLTFNHQIEHDFLAALHLAGERSRWTPAILDAVTFEAASFDVLGFALEELAVESDRDAFLRSLYDWNWRGTITALGAAEHDGSPAASQSLRTALLAVIAEKRFDPVDGTRNRSTQQLERFAGDQPKMMASAASLEQLVEQVAMEPGGPEWFEDWRRMFCKRPGGSEPTGQDLAEIGSADPVIGWTTANVARRFALDPPSCAEVRALYRGRPGADPHDQAVRWRVVHALGAWPDEENAETLIGALGDEYMWVCYGAVRSAVELAAITGDPGLRDWVISELAARASEIQPEPLSQIAYTSRYNGAEAGFFERDTASFETDPRDAGQRVRAQPMEGSHRAVRDVLERAPE